MAKRDMTMGERDLTIFGNLIERGIENTLHFWNAVNAASEWFGHSVEDILDIADRGFELRERLNSFQKSEFYFPRES